MLFVPERELLDDPTLLVELEDAREELEAELLEDAVLNVLLEIVDCEPVNDDVVVFELKTPVPKTAIPATIIIRITIPTTTVLDIALLCKPPTLIKKIATAGSAAFLFMPCHSFCERSSCPKG